MCIDHTSNLQPFQRIDIFGNLRVSHHTPSYYFLGKRAWHIVWKLFLLFHSNLTGKWYFQGILKVSAKNIEKWKSLRLFRDPYSEKSVNRDNRQKPIILDVFDIRHPHFNRHWPGFHISVKDHQYKCHSEGPI